MARLSLSLLGPFKATLNGEPLTDWPSAKVRALLAYLAVESDRAHPREVLAGLLWPDYPERSAHTNLRNALSNLRAVLQDRQLPRELTDMQVRPYILVDRETVQFNPESDAWVDVTVFGNLLKTNLPAEPSDIAHRLGQAAALYQESFLEGFSLRDSPPFEQWVLVVRERLQRQAMEALGRLTALEEERGETERALSYARRQLEVEPWQEGAHQAVMRLLAQSGRRADALAQYEACCRVLKEELNVGPGAETVRLYERIQDGQVGVPEGGRAQAVEPALPAAAQRQHNLPAQSTPFVGRVRELSELERLLSDPQVRLVTVLGPGGSGKTRLALECAAQQVYSFRDGVFLVSLAPIGAAEDMVPAIAEALELAFHPGGEPRQQLLGYLRQRELLLLLDNYEHLLTGSEAGHGDGAGLIADILAAAPGVRVLATSRARLSLQGEYLFPMAGMEYPSLTADLTPGEEHAIAASQADMVSQYSAVQLFLQSARRVRPDLRLEDDLGVVVQLCRLVEGMPLAIVLAASWMDVLSPAEIADQVTRDMGFLEAELRDLPLRQRSMRATFDTSWRLLSEREQRTFGALSVFRGGFTAQAGQEVAEAGLPTLRSLVHKSFLQVDARGRYGIHELLRQYGEEKLRESPEAEQQARDRHCACYAAAAERWAADMKGPRQREAWAEVERELANARVAWTRAIEQGQVERLGQMVEGLCLFYEMRGRAWEGDQTCQAALDELGERSDALALRVRIRLLCWQTRFLHYLFDVERSGPTIRTAQALLARPELAGQDIRAEQALVYLRLGVELFHIDYREARLWLEQSLSLYRAVGDRWGQAEALGELGVAAEYLGDPDGEQFRQESLSIRQSLGDRSVAAEALVRIGVDLAYERGQPEEGERRVRESMAIRRELGDEFGATSTSAWLANMLGLQGRYAAARDVSEQAATYFAGLGLDDRSHEYLLGLGWNEIHLGRYDQALERVQRCLAECDESQRSWYEEIAQDALGCLALATGNYLEARQRLEQSMGRYQRQGDAGGIVAAHIELAYTTRGLGQPEQAWQHVAEALPAAVQRQDQQQMVRSLIPLALLLADRGQAERAIQLYALAWRYPHISQSRWYEDVAGRELAAVAATLPPDVREAAFERGRMRDLWATAQELLAELEG